MAQCNHCTLCWYRKRAEADGLVVTLRPRPSEYFPDGVDVLIHAPGEKPERDPQFKAWFAELPDHCAC